MTVAAADAEAKLEPGAFAPNDGRPHWRQKDLQPHPSRRETVSARKGFLPDDAQRGVGSETPAHPRICADELQPLGHGVVRIGARPEALKQLDLVRQPLEAIDRVAQRQMRRPRVQRIWPHARSGRRTASCPRKP